MCECLRIRVGDIFCNYNEHQQLATIIQSPSESPTKEAEVRSTLTVKHLFANPEMLSTGVLGDSLVSRCNYGTRQPFLCLSSITPEKCRERS